MRKLLFVAALLLLPAVPQAHADEGFTITELTQGMIDPHIIGAVGYNDTTKKYTAILTASIVGPKLGTFPCYLAGAGVGLNTIAPGFEDLPIAAAAFPILTCAPFGERVAIQIGLATPLNSIPDAGHTWYFGLGIDMAGGPEVLKAKRIKRAKAKAERQHAEQMGPEVPSSTLN